MNILIQNTYPLTGFSQIRITISVITDISVLKFYEYIKNIGKISVDILIKILVNKKLTRKTLKFMKILY